jgi:hypothetical protein
MIAKVGKFIVKHTYQLVVYNDETVEITPYGDEIVDKISFTFQFVMDNANDKIRWEIANRRTNGMDIKLFNHNLSPFGTTQNEIPLGTLTGRSLYARYSYSNMDAIHQGWLLVINFGEISND